MSDTAFFMILEAPVFVALWSIAAILLACAVTAVKYAWEYWK